MNTRSFHRLFLFCFFFCVYHRTRLNGNILPGRHRPSAAAPAQAAGGARTRGGGSAFCGLGGAPARAALQPRGARGGAAHPRPSGLTGSATARGRARGRAPAFSQQLHGGLGAPLLGAPALEIAEPWRDLPRTAPGAAQRGLATGALLGAAGSRKQTEGTFSSFSRSPALLFMMPP